MNSDEINELSPRTPTKRQPSSDAKEFLIALSPQKPKLIKENAKSFLDTFHKAAAKLLETMKSKYVNELKVKEFPGSPEGRLEEFKGRLKEVEKLINERIDVHLGVEIMSEAINWLHPFYFKLEDGRLSNLYEESLELTTKGMELLAIGGYKLKNYRLCIKYAKLLLNFKPNNVAMLRLLFSAYTQEGNNTEATNVLVNAKQILTIQDFRKISEEFNWKSDECRRNFRWRRFLKISNLSTLFLSGFACYFFTKYFMKMPENQSVVYGLGAGIISFLTRLLFARLR